MSLIRSNLSKWRRAIISNSLEKLSLLQQWQWLEVNQIQALQQERLTRLLYHAYDHVPYYRNIIRSSGVINDSREINLKKFSRMPLLDKNTIRSRFEDMKSDDLIKRKWYKNTSGGSTGEPVTFIQDMNYHSWSTATTILNDSWTEYSPSERKVFLWGSVRDLFVGSETFKIRLVRWINNELWLNAFQMTVDKMREYVQNINSFKPVQILAYVESIYELSCFIEQEGLRIYSPRAIMTSAGTLFPHMRETIEKVFRAPVFNRYGSREVGNIACECDRHNGLHIASPVNFVEVLRPDGKQADAGETGEIVVTSLTNLAMPLIRYRIGDIGTWAKDTCNCGRGWPILQKVSGRVTDVFLTCGGGVVSPEYFIHLIGVVLNTGWIRKYQVVQEDYEHIRIKIVLHEKVTNPLKVYEKTIESIKQKIVLVMGEGCKVELIFVDDIPSSASGKYRYTISKIKRRH